MNQYIYSRQPCSGITWTPSITSLHIKPTLYCYKFDQFTCFSLCAPPTLIQLCETLSAPTSFICQIMPWATVYEILIWSPLLVSWREPNLWFVPHLRTHFQMERLNQPLSSPVSVTLSSGCFSILISWISSQV